MIKLANKPICRDCCHVVCLALSDHVSLCKGFYGTMYVRFQKAGAFFKCSFISNRRSSPLHCCRFSEAMIQSSPYFCLWAAQCIGPSFLGRHSLSQLGEGFFFFYLYQVLMIRCLHKMQSGSFQLSQWIHSTLVLLTPSIKKSWNGPQKL